MRATVCRIFNFRKMKQVWLGSRPCGNEEGHLWWLFLETTRGRRQEPVIPFSSAAMMKLWALFYS